MVTQDPGRSKAPEDETIAAVDVIPPERSAAGDSSVDAHHLELVLHGVRDRRVA